MRTAITNSILALCVLLFLVQVAFRFAAPRSVATPQIGTAPFFTVSPPGSDEQIPVKDLFPGTCRYVVIADVTCPACVATAETWTRDLSLDGSTAIEPEGWHLFGVVLGGEGERSELVPDGSPFRSYSSRDTMTIAQALSLRAVPNVAVLDRSGTLTATFQGARLPTANSFNPDCTIRADND